MKGRRCWSFRISFSKFLESDTKSSLWSYERGRMLYPGHFYEVHFLGMRILWQWYLLPKRTPSTPGELKELAALFADMRLNPQNKHD